MKRFLCTFKTSQQSGRGKIWHTKYKIYIKVSYEALITFSDISETARFTPSHFFEMAAYDFYLDIEGVFKGQTSSACG